MKIGALKVRFNYVARLRPHPFSSALVEVLKADHGFHVESRAIRDLVEVMSSYDPPMRRAFLQFITGSPKLPIGGMYLVRDGPHVIYFDNQVSGA